MRHRWVAAAAALLVLGAAGTHGSPAAGAAPAAAFRATPRALVVTTAAYELTLSRRNGKLLALDDRVHRTRLLHGSDRCLWGVAGHASTSYLGGCSFSPAAGRRFSYRWLPASSTLELSYRAPAFGSAVVTLEARGASLDARLTIRNRRETQSRVMFPEGLAGDTRTVAAGYAPNALPGVRLGPAFFSRVGSDVQVYPSRWAFADYLALDVGRSHLALYSVNRGPLRPVLLGYLHPAAPAPCSGRSFCLVHEFQTWIEPGRSWTSPLVRIRVGATTPQTILAYRHDNGIDAYPSLQDKLGARLATLARAPLVKANLPLLEPFRDWAGDLGRLPSPALLHPVGFEPGGHDANDPDFLPPDPRFGTSADFASMIAAAHAHGDLVMPYGNLSWWDPASPTLRNLPAPLTTKDVAVLDAAGNPVSIAYGSHSGVIVSPYAPYVRQRIADYMAQWQTEVPADCVFLDQVGARPWLYDFNPASPSPLAYDDGWLAELARYAGRCVMVEDGWDRLARDSVGFHGSLLMMSREIDYPNELFGPGNWEPYPLADWLFHDKVLLYQHDLYDGTMAADDEVLSWNMLFGLVQSYSWDALAPGDNPWLDLVGELQRDFGPRYAGVPLSSYRQLGARAVESVFGDLVVVANDDPAAGYAVDGFGVAPHGFLARTRDGALLAGTFTGAFDGASLSPGTHHVLVERDAASVTVRQPVGPDTELAVDPPLTWTTGEPLEAVALADGGSTLGAVAGRIENGRFVFSYAGTLGGRAVSAYRIEAAGGSRR